jgi:hypothetical protein
VNLTSRIRKLEQLTKFCRCDAPESSIKVVEFVNGLRDKFGESTDADMQKLLQDLPPTQPVPKVDTCIFCEKPFDEIDLEKVKVGDRKFCKMLKTI